jgi:hypothetical protein
MDSSNDQEQPQEVKPTPEVKPEVKLVDIPIKNEFDALNLLVSFLNLAQRRGIFSIDESAKIWECIKMFQKK